MRSRGSEVLCGLKLMIPVRKEKRVILIEEECFRVWVLKAPQDDPEEGRKWNCL